jgi:FkbM family methyltransferase
MGFGQQLRRHPLVRGALAAYRAWRHPNPQERVTRALRTALDGRPCFFLQIGANDGQGDPISELIAANPDWTGMFVEQVSFVFERLKRRYGDSSRFIFENVAVSATSGAREFFYVSEDASSRLDDLPVWHHELGSFDRSHIIQHLGPRIEPFIVAELLPCVPVAELLAKHAVDRIDLVSIDVEGFDYEVLSQLDFTAYRPAAIVFEHLHLSDQERRGANALLDEHGYRRSEFAADTVAVLRR